MIVEWAATYRYGSRYTHGRKIIDLDAERKKRTRRWKAVRVNYWLTEQFIVASHETCDREKGIVKTQDEVGGLGFD